MEYITLLEAAKKLHVTYYGLYCAARRKSLKVVKQNDVLHTTMGWIKEYHKNSRNKEIVSRFNGKKTFDDARQEYSVKRVAKLLGIKRQNVYNLIYAGHLKSFRRGFYHIITQESIERYINKTETIVTEYVA